MDKLFSGRVKIISKEYWEQTKEVQTDKKQILLQIKDYEDQLPLPKSYLRLVRLRHQTTGI